MSVGRICSRQVDVARAGETARSAATFMAQQHVGSLVIMNDEEEPVGLITDRDLVTRILAVGKDPDMTKVEEVMTPDPQTVKEDDSIEKAIAAMRDGGFRRIPVTDEEDKLVGLVTLDDVLSLMSEEFTIIGQLLAQQRPLTLDEP